MKTKIIFLITFIAFSMQLFAGDIARKGTTGAEQLLIPVGARGIAAGGSFLSFISGVESIYYNPAGLAKGPSTDIMFSYMSFLADIGVSYFAIGQQIGDFGTIGFSFKTFDFGNIPVTTNESPDGTGSTYSPVFLTIGLTYSRLLTDRISVGTNIKLISEKIMSASATGVAVDVGVQYRFTESISLGATIKNIGTNMSYQGDDLSVKTEIPNTGLGYSPGTYQVITEDFQIPSYMELSIGYQYTINQYNKINLASNFVANNSFEDNINFGLEYNFNDMFFVRGGYNYALEQSSESIYSFTIGAGINYKVGDEWGFTFDYAYRDVKEFPTANHIFTVGISLD